MFEKLVRFAKNDPIQKSLRGPGIMSEVGWMTKPRSQIQAPGNYEEFAKLYGGQLAWIYTCIYKLAIGARGVPPMLKRHNGTRMVEIEGHPFNTILNGPVNQKQVFADLIEGTITYLELIGDAYWELVTNDTDDIVQIYLLRPDRVTIKATENQKHVKEYWYKVDPEQDPIKYSPEEILHFSYFSPLNDWYGFGTAEGVKASIILELYALDYSKKSLENYGVMDGFLTTDQTISKDQADRIQVDWRKHQNSGQTPLLPKGLEWESISASARDLALDKVRNLTRDEIISAFDVPKSMMGLETPKYDNYRAQERHFYKHVIGPKLDKIADKINAFHLWNYTNPPTLEFDIQSKMPINWSQLADSAAKEVQMGISSPNDVRRRYHLGPDYDGGDTYYRKQNLVPINANTDSNETSNDE